MGASDRGGSKKVGGKKAHEAVVEARQNAELESDWQSNLQINDFLSDLALSLRYKDRIGVDQGDWIEEPARAYSDGNIFGEEVRTISEGKLQITVTLDGSNSMWNQGMMEFAGPTFQALDEMIRKAQAAMPEGVISYAPFLFHETAYRLPEAFRKYFQVTKDTYKYKGETLSRKFKCPDVASLSAFEEAVAAGDLPPMPVLGSYESGRYLRKYKLSGEDTLVAPLFKAISEWEADNDHNATRLDIIITDGMFENKYDVEEASHIQEQRNGKLSTVLLNFLPVHSWHKALLPERCIQYPVTIKNLNNSIRSIIEETISGMS